MFNFGWGSSPDPAEGAYTALAGPLNSCKNEREKEGDKEGNEGRFG